MLMKMCFQLISNRSKLPKEIFYSIFYHFHFPPAFLLALLQELTVHHNPLSGKVWKYANVHSAKQDICEECNDTKHILTEDFLNDK